MTSRKDIGHVDAALQKLGPFGKYTLMQFSMQILTQFAIATHMLSIVFTGQKNPFRCPVSSSNETRLNAHEGNLYTANSSQLNVSQPDYDSVCRNVQQTSRNGTPSSNITDDCQAHGVEYQLPKNLYFVSEFDLVCDREFLAGLTQTLLTLGHAIGSLMVPYFADNYGRKPVLMICSFLWFGSCLGLAFAVNYPMLAVFKTLVGIFLQGVAQTSVTVMMEILTSQQRGQMFGSLCFIFWTLSTMMMIPVAYLLRFHSWRYLEFAYCGYFIYIFLYLLFIDESLRWLAANGMTERVMDVLKRASKWNGSNLDDVISVFYKGDEKEISNNDKVADSQITDCKMESDKSEEKLKENTLSILEETRTFQENDVSEDKLSCMSLFTNRLLRNSTLFSMMAWFFNSLTYYALLLMSSSLSGSLYLNYFLNCVVEIPSAIFIYFFIDRLGRKVCFASFSIIAGGALIAAAIVSTLFYEQNVVIKVLTILGKFGISGSFATIYMMTPELFPTNVRTTGLGLANMSACLGGMLAPFAGLLLDKAVYAPGLIFGISSLALSAWTYILPETARRQLPQSLKDIELWVHEQKKEQKDPQKLYVTDKTSHINPAFTE